MYGSSSLVMKNYGRIEVDMMNKIITDGFGWVVGEGHSHMPLHSMELNLHQ